jgi:hypothetical protein
MMAKIRSEGTDSDGKRGPGRPAKTPTRSVRAPLEVADMIELIAVQEINGWTSAADVLGDKSCPLKDWLMPHYLRAVEQAVKRSEQIKKRK